MAVFGCPPSGVCRCRHFAFYCRRKLFCCSILLRRKTHVTFNVFDYCLLIARMCIENSVNTPNFGNEMNEVQFIGLENSWKSFQTSS